MSLNSTQVSPCGCRKNTYLNKVFQAIVVNMSIQNIMEIYVEHNPIKRVTPPNTNKNPPHQFQIMKNDENQKEQEGHNAPPQYLEKMMQLHTK